MDYLSNFPETLAELMDERGIMSKELAKIIGTAESNLRHWKAGTYKLYLHNALKLADFFDCSLEYLAGRTDARLDYTKKTCPPFYQRFRQVLKEMGKSGYRIKKDLALANAHFARWKNGSDPTMDTVIRLADYLGCTVDHLVGRED